MKKRLTERELFVKAARLARQKGVAFGVEYFPSEKIWRCIVASDPMPKGCFWRHLGAKPTRRAALQELVNELEALESEKA